MLYSIAVSRVTWTLMGLVIFLHFFGDSDFQDKIENEVIYCKMVNMYQASNGEVGWPDYEKKGCPTK